MTCDITWRYDPPYDHPPHPVHSCKRPLGHTGDHECVACECWVTDTGLKYYGKPLDTPTTHE
jgi:hypothetical protein